MRTYRELKNLKTFEERFEYLKLNGIVGSNTFGYDRYLNQKLYTSTKWKRTRDHILIRDLGCDLGVEGYEIFTKPIIHHMNPITIDEILHNDESIFDPNYLICTSHNTHNAIHYGGISLLSTDPIIRRRNDTCPWK